MPSSAQLFVGSNVCCMLCVVVSELNYALPQDACYPTASPAALMPESRRKLQQSTASGGLASVSMMDLGCLPRVQLPRTLGSVRDAAPPLVAFCGLHGRTLDCQQLCQHVQDVNIKWGAVQTFKHLLAYVLRKHCLLQDSAMAER